MRRNCVDRSGRRRPSAPRAAALVTRLNDKSRPLPDDCAHKDRHYAESALTEYLLIPAAVPPEVSYDPSTAAWRLQRARRLWRSPSISTTLLVDSYRLVANRGGEAHIELRLGRRCHELISVASEARASHVEVGGPTTGVDPRRMQVLLQSFR